MLQTITLAGEGLMSNGSISDQLGEEVCGITAVPELLIARKRCACLSRLAMAMVQHPIGDLKLQAVKLVRIERRSL